MTRDRLVATILHQRGHRRQVPTAPMRRRLSSVDDFGAEPSTTSYPAITA